MCENNNTVKNMIQRKENFFPRGRKTSGKFETIVITTNGNNQNLRAPWEEDNEVHIIPEAQLSQNKEGEYVQVSTETNSFLYYDQGALRGRNNNHLIFASKNN